MSNIEFKKIENVYKIVKFFTFRTLSYKIKFRYYQNLFSFLIFAPQKYNDAVKIVILSIILVAFAIVLLGVKVLFVKGGKFPSGHAHDIAALRGNRK